MTRWIVIPNWNELQHYKNRDPEWIKVYRRLLVKDEFLELHTRARSLLLGVWLLYASKDGVLREQPRSIAAALRQQVFSKDLELLEQAGFIEFSASKPLALSKQRASLEKEQEGEIEKDKLDKPASKSAFQAPETALLRRVV